MLVPRQHSACPLPSKDAAMLDLAFLLIGAGSFGACALYVFACDHL
jgi:hypothetical protein